MLPATLKSPKDWTPNRGPTRIWMVSWRIVEGRTNSLNSMVMGTFSDTPSRPSRSMSTTRRVRAPNSGSDPPPPPPPQPTAPRASPAARSAANRTRVSCGALTMAPPRRLPVEAPSRPPAGSASPWWPLPRACASMVARMTFDPRIVTGVKGGERRGRTQLSNFCGHGPSPPGRRRSVPAKVGKLGASPTAPASRGWCVRCGRRRGRPRGRRRGARAASRRAGPRRR